MFESLSRYLGVLSVEVTGDYVVVNGLPTQRFFKDVVKVWGTSSPINNMLVPRGSSSFKINSFFLPDLMKTLELLMTLRYRNVSKLAITKLTDILKEKTWIGDTFKEYPSILDHGVLKDFVWTSLDHQDEFYAEFSRSVQQMHLDGFLLAAKAGSGKTFMQIAISRMLHSEIFIWVSPKNAVERVWKPTLAEQYKGKAKVWASTDNAPLKSGYNHYIVHYEQLTQFVDFVKRSPEFQNKKIFIGVDECQNFNEITSQRTNMLIELHQSIPASNRKAVWGSGTPFKALGTEVIPFLRANDPLFTQEVEGQFLRIFGKNSKRALGILASRIGLISFKVPAHVVTGDKPPIEYPPVYVKIANPDRYTLPAIKLEMATFIRDRLAFYKQHADVYESDYRRGLELYEATLTDKTELKTFKDYTDMSKLLRDQYEFNMDNPEFKAIVIFCNTYEKKVLTALSTIDREARTKFEKAKSIYKYMFLTVQGEALGGVLGKRREECITEIAQAIDYVSYISEAEKKTLIFSNYIASLTAAKTATTNMGYYPLTVYGNTTKDLPKTVDTFFKDDTANPLLATIQSLSTAVPLIVANTILFLNQPFRSHDREQAVARVARLGQDTQTHVYSFYADTGDTPNISTRSGEILKWSEEQVAIIMSETPIPSEGKQMLLAAFSGNDNALSGLLDKVRKWFM